MTGYQTASGDVSLAYCARIWSAATGVKGEARQIISSAAFMDFLTRTGAATPAVTPLFDNQFYAGQIAWQVNETNLLLHYCRYASGGRLEPHPLFDSDFVRARCAVTDASEPPLLTYLTHAGAVLDPHPLLDLAVYRDTVGEEFLAGQSPLEAFLTRWTERPAAFSRYFSWRYYALHEPGVRYGHGNPLMHFLRTPVAYRQDPNPLFQRAWYAAQSDHQVTGEPLVHFLSVGLQRGLMPNPFAAAELGTESIGRSAAAVLLRSYIDTIDIDRRGIALANATTAR